VLTYLPEILLHVSRGVRWDSDHVVILNDDLQAIAREIVCNGYMDRVHIGLDYFDASINRIAAWLIGARNMLRALLIALLEPPTTKTAEAAGDLTARLALQEEAKSLPFGAVWDFYCGSKGPPSATRGSTRFGNMKSEFWLTAGKLPDPQESVTTCSPSRGHTG
jgi:L-rhamnose isomerase